MLLYLSLLTFPPPPTLLVFSFFFSSKQCDGLFDVLTYQEVIDIARTSLRTNGAFMKLLFCILPSTIYHCQSYIHTLLFMNSLFFSFIFFYFFYTGDVDIACRKLIRRALDKGTTDNVSVIIICLNQ